MHATNFSCPHCSAPLRVRDRMFVGREIACPECQGPLRIVSQGPKGLAAEKLERPTAPIKPQRASTPFWKNPATIAWSLAVCLSLGLGAYVLRPEPSDRGATGAVAPTESTDSETVAPETEIAAAEKNVEQDPAEKVVARLPAIAPRPSPEELLPPPSIPIVAADDEPLDPLMADEELDVQAAPVESAPMIDVAAALAQSIASYQTRTGVTVRTLLDELSEMVGVPIEMDGDLEGRDELLDRRVSLKLERTTLGGIVEAVAREVGLVSQVGAGRVRIVRPASAAEEGTDRGT